MADRGDTSGARRKRGAKNSGLPVVLPEILNAMLSVPDREKLLNDLLVVVTSNIGKEITPKIVENIMLTSLLPLLHDEIAMALSGSAEARRYLLDKMIPKAERTIAAPPLNISIFLDGSKQKTIEDKNGKAIDVAFTTIGENNEVK